MNEALITLYQHFGNAGRSTEVSVYLERRMRIKQILIYSSHRVIHADNCQRRKTECGLKQAIRMISILKTCPTSYFPRTAPSCSHISTRFECLLCCISKQRIAMIRDLIAGIQSYQLRKMTVFITFEIQFSLILLPLFNLPP